MTSPALVAGQQGRPRSARHQLNRPGNGLADRLVLGGHRRPGLSLILSGTGPPRSGSDRLCIHLLTDDNRWSAARLAGPAERACSRRGAPAALRGKAGRGPGLGGGAAATEASPWWTTCARAARLGAVQWTWAGAAKGGELSWSVPVHGPGGRLVGGHHPFSPAASPERPAAGTSLTWSRSTRGYASKRHRAATGCWIRSPRAQTRVARDDQGRCWRSWPAPVPGPPKGAHGSPLQSLRRGPASRPGGAADPGCRAAQPPAAGRSSSPRRAGPAGRPRLPPPALLERGRPAAGPSRARERRGEPAAGLGRPSQFLAVTFRPRPAGPTAPPWPGWRRRAAQPPMATTLMEDAAHTRCGWPLEAGGSRGWHTREAGRHCAGSQELQRGLPVAAEPRGCGPPLTAIRGLRIQPDAAGT